jgi:hypothetical protein
MGEEERLQHWKIAWIYASCLLGGWHCYFTGRLEHISGVKAKEINKEKKEGKKMLPGDFTVSEGHGHPLIILSYFSYSNLYLHHYKFLYPKLLYVILF